MGVRLCRLELPRPLSSLARAAHAPAPALHEGRLLLEDPERLLEARDLGLAPAHPLLIRLWLRDAAVLELRVVLHHGAELGVRRVAVAGVLPDGLVQSRGLGSLVFYVLVFQRLRD